MMSELASNPREEPKSTAILMIVSTPSM